MNLIDRIITAVSPEAGYRRELWRQGLEELRGYDAAGYDRVNAGWRVFNESAETTDRNSRDVVRARARDLECNSDIAQAILHAYKRNVVGKGYDWFCRDDVLAGRLKKIGRVVMGITDPFILDNYYVWFKNNCPLDGPLYDDVRFEPLSGKRDGKYFVVALDSPHERAKWALVTERYGFDAPEFECGNIRDMVRYINGIGPQLRQGIKPPFIAEKDAVTAYALRRGEPEGIHIYREGNHNYSYISRQDRKRRTVMAVASLEDAPPGFAAGQAVSINGLHVYCPEDAGKPLPDPERASSKSHIRKEPER